MTTTSDLAFIGDRPAQMAALVLDAPVTYTTDRADPFMVQRLVERWIARAIGTRGTRVILSTGLTWAPKYDGMAARQVNTLIGGATRIYVLPVSSSHILGHALNVKLEQICEGSRLRREFSMFLGGAHPLWSFAGNTISPLSPTPVEILTLADVITNLIKLDTK